MRAKFSKLNKMLLIEKIWRSDALKIRGNIAYHGDDDDIFFVDRFEILPR
jgi:hypothetical protein